MMCHLLYDNAGNNYVSLNVLVWYSGMLGNSEPEHSISLVKTNASSQGS